jgi:hypothetical protein
MPESRVIVNRDIGCEDSVTGAANWTGLNQLLVLLKATVTAIRTKSTKTEIRKQLAECRDTVADRSQGQIARPDLSAVPVHRAGERSGTFDACPSQRLQPLSEHQVT